MEFSFYFTVILTTRLVYERSTVGDGILIFCESVTLRFVLTFVMFTAIVCGEIVSLLAGIANGSSSFTYEISVLLDFVFSLIS